MFGDFGASPNEDVGTNELDNEVENIEMGYIESTQDVYPEDFAQSNSSSNDLIERTAAIRESIIAEKINDNWSG